MNLEKKFQNACKKGNINDAKKLLYDYPHIDIFADDNYAFCVACWNGHLNIAKWLFQINPQIDISADNEFIFRSCHMAAACATSNKYF